MNILWMLLCVAGMCAQADADRRLSLLDDLVLARGFRLSALRSSTSPIEIGVVLSDAPDREPRWRLAQWGSRFCLSDVCETTSPEGVRTLANAGKTVKIFPGGLVGEGVVLGVHGGREYDGRLRRHGEPWPHLLLEQVIDEIRLHSARAFEFSVEFKVISGAPAIEEALDPSLHTAHVNAFWTIHNKNPNSPNYNDMIWFGLPLYDARYPVPLGHQAVDAGQADATGKFICTIAGARFYDEPVTIGQWHRLECDLAPLLIEALEAARRHGFLWETHFDNLAMTSFNIGWEVPGPYNCALWLRGLKLEAVPGTPVQ